MYIINTTNEHIIEKGKRVTINSISGDVELYNCAGTINITSGDVELNKCVDISVNSVCSDIFLFNTKADVIDCQSGWIDISESKINTVIGTNISGKGIIVDLIVKKKETKFNLFNPFTWFAKTPDVTIPKEISVSKVFTDGKVYSFTPVEIVGKGKNIILKENYN